MFANKQKIMRLKRKSRLQSTKKDTTSSSQTQQQQSATTTQSWSLYRSIYELPFAKFIECVVDNNLLALVREGYPPQEEILKAWYEINEQYSSALGDAEYSVYFSLFKRIAILTTDYNSINKIVEVLRFMYYEPLANELNALLKTNFKFDPS